MTVADLLINSAAVTAVIAVLYIIAYFIWKNAGDKPIPPILDRPGDIVVFLLILTALLAAVGELIQPGSLDIIRHTR